MSQSNVEPAKKASKSQSNVKAAKKALKNSAFCGHFMCVWDHHEYCAKCREDNVGTDACVVLGEEDCELCSLFTDEQKRKLSNRKRYKKKDKPLVNISLPIKEEVNYISFQNTPDERIEQLGHALNLSAVKIEPQWDCVIKEEMEGSPPVFSGSSDDHFNESDATNEVSVRLSDDAVADSMSSRIFNVQTQGLVMECKTEEISNASVKMEMPSPQFEGSSINGESQLNQPVCDIEQSKQSNITGNPERPYNCTLCDKSYTTKHWLRRHVLKHSDKRPYHCTFCDHTFPLPEQLKSHLTIHTDDTPHICTVCGQIFFQPSELRSHMFIHTGPKPYSCKLCDKSFNGRSNLKNHMLVHNPEKPHRCGVCDKSFRNPATLKRHLMVHIEKKPYSCTICDKSFSESAYLKSHMYNHTGERPFTCTVCNQSFTLRQVLTRHMYIHMGEKPHRCTLCDKSFTRAGYLKTHMSVHTGVKPFNCSLCDKSFTQSISYKKHMLSHTGES